MPPPQDTLPTDRHALLWPWRYAPAAGEGKTHARSAAKRIRPIAPLIAPSIVTWTGHPAAGIAALRYPRAKLVATKPTTARPPPWSCTRNQFTWAEVWKVSLRCSSLASKVLATIAVRLARSSPTGSESPTNRAAYADELNSPTIANRTSWAIPTGSTTVSSSDSGTVTVLSTVEYRTKYAPGNRHCHHRQGGANPTRKPGPSVKDPKLYEKLRDEGNSKQKAARIANQAARTSRSKVGSKGGGSGSYDDWTVDKLRKRAAEIGISGRSSMNKTQLVKALRNS